MQPYPRSYNCIMKTSRETYAKYFGHSLNQDPVKRAVVRAFCSLLRHDDHAAKLCGMISDETARGVLDDEDYKVWVSAKAEVA